jgi:hypothetical protein
MAPFGLQELEEDSHVWKREDKQNENAGENRFVA